MLSRRFRPWAFGLAGFALLTTYGLLRTPANYSTPIFQTVHQIAPLELWAVIWGGVGVSSLASAITRRALPWRLASTAAVGAAVTWMAGISWEAWVDGARLSWTGWGLWAWFAWSNVQAVTSRHQFVPKELP